MKSKRLAQLTLQLLCAASFAGLAHAEDFNIPRGDLKAALDSYATQTGTQFIYESAALKGIQTQGVHGNLSADTALSRILTGTGFIMRKDATGAIGISRTTQSVVDMSSMVLAQAAPARAAVETVTVTSSKLGGADVQSIPIAITALSQEQLTATQTAGGPDLIKQVPNMTFTKTNFSGYSIQIRGIGTQAISVTTDPAVAVAFNDTPFIRNHFFEQEFFDVAQVAVLRGPQGTLYGRNATAGVVNLTSARPSDQFEAMASGEIGNYSQRRFEGMINLPIVDDRLDIRLAGEWTKREGYSFNELTDKRIDGRDLWSGRMTIGVKPIANMQTYLIWEHFSEDDDRIRSSKQLCKKDPGKKQIGSLNTEGFATFSQGCLPVSLYSDEAFQTPNGYSLPYWAPLSYISIPIRPQIDPYASATQSKNLRVIESANDPIYKAKNDIVEFNTDYAVTPALTLTSQTGFNHDFLYATQDYNRFNTQPGVFFTDDELGEQRNLILPDGTFCDPQLGCSNRLVAQDLVQQNSWQLSQEFRFATKFEGPLNFSVGGNYLHYETFEKYYVFINSLSLYAATRGTFVEGPYQPGVSDGCVNRHTVGQLNESQGLYGCIYMDPNPINALNDDGHNYFLSKNPYVLDSYAAFGELYYDITQDLKLTGGLRWTEDRKHFSQIPSWVVVPNTWGYPVMAVIDQQWDQLTGRINATWSPKLDFTDQTLIYGSYGHGYKAGGANPPGAVLLGPPVPTHPSTFKPEFIDAFEMGTKNTLLDGALTLNLSAFYYDYKGYQISQIVDRTSVNLNFDAKVKGAEIEAMWEPMPGLRFNLSGGWEDSALAKGSKAIDLIDRTAGMPGWYVVKPFADIASNCVLPAYVLERTGNGGQFTPMCKSVNVQHVDPVTGQPYVANPIQLPGYPGYDPDAPENANGSIGFYKDLSGKELPNAPPFTLSFGAQYSVPLTSDWAGTLRTDFYWQDKSWARVFNFDPYDRLRGYNTVNLALILTSQSGWQVMLFDKNVFNTTAITGTFLNSDDTALTTNVFLTDPKLIGIRVTKNW